MAEPIDFRFGHMAIKRGFVSLDQIKECVRIKSEMEENGIDLRLGELLVRKNYMSQEQVEEITQNQTKRAPVQSGARSDGDS